VGSLDRLGGAVAILGDRVIDWDEFDIIDSFLGIIAM